MEEIPNLAKAFGLTLRAYRERVGMTQGKLAQQIGSVNSYIRFLEYGQKIPTLNTFHHICMALHVDPHEFMSEYLQNMSRLNQKK